MIAETKDLKNYQVNEDNGANYRWLQKEIKDQQVIAYDREKISLYGVGTLDVVTDFTHYGSTSILLTTSTDIEDIRPRPLSKVLISLKEYNLTKYNRISVWVYPKAEGFQNFYFHFTLYFEKGKMVTHTDSLIPNKWNLVTWEVPHDDLTELTQICLGPILLGCPPEAEAELKVYFDELAFQLVDADDDLGWDLKGRIAYCHSGYFAKAQKIALTQVVKDDNFYVKDEKGLVVYTGVPQKVETEIGTFYQLDFSSLEKEGNFYIEIDDERKTGIFSIGQNPFERSIWKSINFIRKLRCGDDVEGVHSPCHLNSYTTAPDGKMVPNFGGWHDAGDVSQFEICTAEIAHSLLDLASRISDEHLKEQLLIEARYGLNWLLRTRFGNGERALAVHYSIWRKNVLKSINHINPVSNLQNVSENGPYENFLAAGALAVAGRMYENDQVFANWCKRVAIEDFRFGVEGFKQGLFTKRWGIVPDPQIGGAVALAAAELYVLTGEKEYLQIGSEFSDKILAAQQAIYPNWKKPLRGFFYEDASHRYPLTYEHRGHEQDPVFGLARLLEVAPNYPDADKWRKGLDLYREFIEKTADLCAPYGLLPAQVYDLSNINMERFTIPASFGTKEEALINLQNQIRQGVKLDDHIYLRRFPIAIQRRGFHATLLSKTKAVSLLSKIFNDQKLKQIALNQLEWVFGKNPFSSSTMYGEGYNYHPLYVAFSPQIIGALPVGIKTKDDDDLPYWPVVNNAVYKEVWGHTTAKYLWILADLI